LIVAPKSPPPSKFSKLKAMVVKFASILSDESCQQRTESAYRYNDRPNNNFCTYGLAFSRYSGNTANN
jgi:hypothetical protein